MKLSQIIFRAALIVITLAASLTVLAQRKNETEKWEYLITSGCNSGAFWRDGRNLLFDEIGERGWELVGISNRGDNCPEFYFKRPKVAGRVEKPLPTSPPPRTPEPEKAPQCDLTLAQAPVIRGLKLGMSLDEVFALFPGSNLDGRIAKEMASSEDFGLSRVFINLENYPQAKEKFSGINYISFTLFDRKVVGLNISYQTANGANWSIEKLLPKFIETFKLPSIERWNYNNLHCQGFNITINNQAQYVEFSLTDNSYQKLQEQRREAFRESKRQEFKP